MKLIIERNVRPTGAAMVYALQFTLQASDEEIELLTRHGLLVSEIGPALPEATVSQFLNQRQGYQVVDAREAIALEDEITAGCRRLRDYLDVAQAYAGKPDVEEIDL